jgi:hypothetical protein
MNLIGRDGRTDAQTTLGRVVQERDIISPTQSGGVEQEVRDSPIEEVNNTFALASGHGDHTDPSWEARHTQNRRALASRM